MPDDENEKAPEKKRDLSRFVWGPGDVVIVHPKEPKDD